MFFDFITHYGGAQRSTVQLCKRLRAHYDLQIVDAYGFCKPYLTEMIDSGLNIQVLMERESGVVIGHSEKPLLRLAKFFLQVPHFFELARRLGATISRLHPDLIWTNNTKALLLLWIIRFWKKVPVGLFARGWCCAAQISLWQRILIKKSTDVIFAISNPTKRAMIEWGADSRKLYVVHTALAVNKLMYGADSNPYRNRLGDKRDFVILVPGTLLYTKGQHIVINAVRRLKNKNGRKIIVWFAGDTGVGDSAGYAQKLEKKVAGYGLKENVKFLGWREDMHGLMQAADVMVLPTHTEGLPRVVQEAILLKCPVISTKVGGIPDLLSNGETGFLTEVDDEVTIAEKIQYIIENTDQTRKMAERAYHHYCRKFTVKNQIKSFQTAVGDTLSE